MEGHPDTQESRFNDKLKGFARKMLDNDLFAAAVVQTNNAHAPLGEGWEHFGGEPSLIPLDDGKIKAGIQLGYERKSYYPGTSILWGTSRKYIYTDFFVIDPSHADHPTISEELTKAIEALRLDPEQSYAILEEAWQLWLTELYSTLGISQEVFLRPNILALGDTDLVNLVVDKYTGEIGPGYNIPPGHAVEIRLPPIDQPFQN